MNKNAKKMIATIKSGKFEKTDGRLSGDNGERYCILGAIDRCYADMTGKSQYDPANPQADLPSTMLPEVVRRFFGFKSKAPEMEGEYLEDINDGTSLSLPRIATKMEENAVELFVRGAPRKKRKKKQETGPTLAEFLGGELPKPVFVDAYIKAHERQLQKA